MTRPRPTPTVYCTYFDSGYLSRGLTLIESMRAHGEESPVIVLALDNDVKEFFDAENMPGVTAILVEDLEKAEPALLPLKSARSRMEYYFTCTPLLVRYAMNLVGTPGSTAIYVDADLFFFDAPRKAVDALGDGSVGIIEHRYPTRLAQRLAKYGRFNVGWVAFVDDEDGRRVLDWYSQSTLDWCGDTPLDGKYADQGYLNSFPDFAGVKILHSAAFDLAPWNTARHDIRLVNNAVSVDGDPLNFFHVHGLRKVGNWYVTAQGVYGAKLTSALKRGVYEPYVRALERWDAYAQSKLPARSAPAQRGVGLKGFAFRSLKSVLNRWAILTGAAISSGK
ncbi:unannotated protein [freshwater metagenome]|uniref:Unannotated protein n=1 Tax=freshwater metagenome TaxID=449393 RepID=A0A6J6DAG7_9ZZZZ|nr:hypothetical protein [Actinomycetota bacterium]